MTIEPSVKEIVFHLLRGAIPERADELMLLWQRYGHDIEVHPDAQGILMNADSAHIKFNTKTIDFFWLHGFSIWYALEVYGPALYLTTDGGMSLDYALDIDVERGSFEFEYKQRVAVVDLLFTAETTTDISWPHDIPMPTADRESLGTIEHQLVFDLISIALAFAFLHEFRHVMYLGDNGAPATLPEEEIACDHWARNFMTGHLVAENSANGGHCVDVKKIRAMGMVLATTTIHAMTPSHARWGSRQYPPFTERMKAIIGNEELPADSHFWVFAGCMLIALLRKEHRTLNLVASSNKELVEKLLDYF